MRRGPSPLSASRSGEQAAKHPAHREEAYGGEDIEADDRAGPLRNARRRRDPTLTALANRDRLAIAGRKLADVFEIPGLIEVRGLDEEA
jgi:hypothetical protein